MKRAFSLFVLILLLLGCGNKETATGGPLDTERPEIWEVYPAEYADITGSDIEITFSKPMDYSSFSSGMRIYPEILSKSFRWEDNTLIITINDSLQQDTNYLFTFTEKLKCYHNNALDRQYDLTWASGSLNDYKISGAFSFEELEDADKAVKVSLFTADTTLITTREFTGSYEFDALNKGGHFLRAYIDKNTNKRLDPEKEPFAEEAVPSKAVATIDLALVYSDSTAPELKRSKAIYGDEIEIEFSEPLLRLKTVKIVSDSLGEALQIKRWRIAEEKVRVFCTSMDTIAYNVYTIGAEDKKGNISELDSLNFAGIVKVDSIAPVIKKIDPRDGSSVTSLRPEIKVIFDEIIFKEHADAWLVETESGAKYPLKTISGDNETIIFRPMADLRNFNSYKLHLQVSDPRGNQLSGFEGSVFLPIVNQQ